MNAPQPVLTKTPPWHAIPVTYLLAGAGGFVAHWLHLPLAWLIGALFTVAATSLACRACPVMPGGRQAGQAVVGATLGLYFTPTVTQAMLGALPWMLLNCVVALVVGAMGARLMSRHLNLSPATAFFACVPGGAAEMAVLGERNGGDPAMIAAAHSLRVVIVVSSIPFLLTGLNVHGSDPYQALRLPIDAAGLAQLALACLAVGFACHRLNWPNAWLTGSLIASLALTLSGHAASSVPPLLTILAQILIGTALGARFRRGSFAQAGTLTRVLILTILQGMLMLAAFAVLLSLLPSFHLSTMLLATAAGGIAEMCLTAQALQLGVPLVTGFHVLRLVGLLSLAPPVFRWWMRRHG